MPNDVSFGPDWLQAWRYCVDDARRTFPAFSYLRFFELSGIANYVPLQHSTLSDEDPSEGLAWVQITATMLWLQYLKTLSGSRVISLTFAPTLCQSLGPSH